MELTIHSGMGRPGPFVEIKKVSEYPNHTVTTYTFTDYTGAELVVKHFEHHLEYIKIEEKDENDWVEEEYIR